ncbi:TIGR03084 family metal-binding protein [Nocardioides maradonensis]
MSVLDDVLTDLGTESDQLRAAVAPLTEEQWQLMTPAEGWSIATTIGHLLWTDTCAVLAAQAVDPANKQPWDDVVLEAIADPTGFVDKGAVDTGSMPVATLLEGWDAGRAGLAMALREVPEGAKMPWFGPPMSPTSMATARFMETWAHSLDVYDALIGAGLLAAPPQPTDRIKHVAHIGVRTRGFAFANNGLEAPTEEFRVELTAPSGERWAWGPEDAPQRVTGSADDFCRLVTQRVHRDDTDLVAVGEDAEKWLSIAQAFAGPAGGGRDKK